MFTQLRNDNELFSSCIIIIDQSKEYCVRIVCGNFRFIILSVVSGVALVYSAAVILMPRTRETILKRRFRFGTPTGVEALVRKTQVRLIFLIQIEANLDYANFNENIVYKQQYDKIQSFGKKITSSCLFSGGRLPTPSPARSKHVSPSIR